MAAKKFMAVSGIIGILAISAFIALAGFLQSAAAQSVEIKTEFFMILYAPLQPAQAVNTDLSIVHIREGGYVEGPSIKGKILQPAGDWIRRMPNGTSRQEARLTIQTDDNSLIYMEYGGVGKLGKEASARFGKGEILGAEEAYYVIAPRFQTTSAKYAWLNDVQAIGRMVSLKRGDHIEYEIFLVR
jgi:hypothetical protein